MDSRNAVIVEDLYDAYGVSCYRLAHRMVADEQLACTIVRQVFLAVWSGDSAFDPALGSVQSWLIGATHRRAVTAVRRQRQLSGGLLDRKMVVAAPALGAEPTFGTKQRYVLELAYYSAHTQPEIATLLGTAVGTIKSLTRDALRELDSTRPSPRQSQLPQPS